MHLSAERFRIAAEFEAVHVPFKSGSEAMTEVITGRVDYFFAPLATVLPFIREGQVVPLAVSSRSRAEQLPDVPTTIEAGFPNSDYTPWSASSDPPAFGSDCSQAQSRNHQGDAIARRARKTAEVGCATDFDLVRGIFGPAQR